MVICPVPLKGSCLPTLTCLGFVSLVKPKINSLPPVIPLKIQVGLLRKWGLRSLRCPRGALGSGFHAHSLSDRKLSTNPIPINKAYWKEEIGQEERLFVDLTTSDLSVDIPGYKNLHQAIIWLFLQTFKLPLDSSPYILFLPLCEFLLHFPLENKTGFLPLYISFRAFYHQLLWF